VSGKSATRPDSDVVAEAFGADPALVPLLPTILSGLSALGAWPDHVETLLRRHAVLTKDSRVVDLGCGKGVLAVRIARTFHCSVTGLDLFEPFLESARVAAEHAGVTDRCVFEREDIQQVRDSRVESFDLAVLSAVGAGTFGTYADCIASIRRWVGRGGSILIGDGVLRHRLLEDAEFTGYGYYEPKKRAVQELTSCGDTLVDETPVPQATLIEENRRSLEAIREGVERAVRRCPGAREGLERFVQDQRAEMDFLEEHTIELLWLLGRTP